MTAYLDLPDRFGAWRAAEWFADWRRVHDAPELIIRAEGLALLDPAGVVLLAAGLAQRAKQQLETRFETDPRIEPGYDPRWTAIADLLRLGEPRGELSLLPGGMLVGLRPIPSEKTAWGFARDCEALLEEQLPGLSSKEREATRDVIEELGINIVQHSGSPETGFAMVQAWSNLPRMQIAVADAGVGFLASLQRNLEFKGRIQTDGEALEKALVRGVSGSDPSRNSGLGLDMLKTLADRLEGRLWMASGSDMLHRRTVEAQRTNTIASVTTWPGAWICLDVQLGREVRLDSAV